MKLSSENLNFMAGVSHEIRNPINAIIGIAHLLQKENQKDVQEELLQILLVTSENLRELTNNILDFTKLEEGKVPRNITSIDIRKEIRMVLLGQEVIAKAKGLELVINIDDNVPSRVMLDKVRAMQILINLVSNAIKFTQEGRITLEAKALESTESEVTLFFAVRDTGMGISEEKQAQIFEPFRQGGSSINFNHGGTGLGLTIANMLVASAGGKIMLKSKVNQGSEFSFIVTLKLPEISDTQLPAQRPVSLTKVLRNLKVLIVDDNKINLQVTSKTFENWGIKYSIANNGIEAVAKVQEEDFGLVLMDLHMPKMDGYTASSAIRKIEKEKFLSLPILAISGSIDFFQAENMNANGFSGFLAKPYNPQELLEKILEVLCEKK
ncbi:MAG TPA: ATP-binding protein [Gillisia sp.]|nr:ATP-binding protein [Gillisia sp.]